MNRSKALGTAGETAVVNYMRAHGFATAERRALAGVFDLGDVTGVPGLVVEVKSGQAAANASDGRIAAWMTETERERDNADADFGLLVLKRAGIGVLRAGEWWAFLPAWQFVALLGVPGHAFSSNHPVRLHLRDAITLLRLAGYGDSIDKDIAA